MNRIFKKNSPAESGNNMNHRGVKGKWVSTFTDAFYNANILEAEAGTNGYCGGDTGHGSRTYIRLADLGGTDMHIQVNDSYNPEVEIMLGGDAELTTIIEAFRWVADTLEDQAKRYAKERKRIAKRGGNDYECKMD